ncbi:MAG: trigger factor [Planctomycetes bacterium]|nr:trigger factor [Planctomycetota bacterium]
MMVEETEKTSKEQKESEAEKTEAADTVADENQAPAEQEELPPDAVTVEEIDTLRRKVTVRVDKSKIESKFDEMFGELGRSAQIPGFRIGRAPRRLIEKRFGKEIAADVRNAVVAEAMDKALKQADFKPFGNPEIKLEEIELPENDDLTFSFEVDVVPEFELPDYEGIEITRPSVEITDKQVDDALEGYRRGYGRFVPTDKPAQKDDVILADVVISGEGIDHKVPNAEMRVAAGEVEGIPIENLADVLTGARAGETCEVSTKVPAAHPREDWRDKQVKITFEVKDVKRLELPELNDAFAERLGFGSLSELRQAIRDDLEARANFQQRQSMHEQVKKFLLDNTDFELPKEHTQRLADRILTRRYINLLNLGVPREKIDENLQKLRQEASEQAAVEMKLYFILDKLAQEMQIEVDDAEVNARIAQIAARYNRRPERLRREMTDDGSLEELIATIRSEKAIEKVLEKAKIVDEVPEEETSSTKASSEADKQGKSADRKKASKVKSKKSASKKGSKKSGNNAASKQE